MNKAGNEWYGVRCLFDHGPSELIEGARMYEERIVILRAASWEEVIAKAEADAEAYCRALEDTEYLGLAQAYLVADDIADDSSQERAEVFSLMRSSPLSAAAYIARFFATGTEHQHHIEDDPD